MQRACTPYGVWNGETAIDVGGSVRLVAKTGLPGWRRANQEFAAKLGEEKEKKSKIKQRNKECTGKCCR